MTAQLVVVSDTGTFYGPFDNSRKAIEWARHPNRTFDSYSIHALFGGVLLQDDAAVAAADDDDPFGGKVVAPPGAIEDAADDDEPEDDGMVLVPKDRCEAYHPIYMQCWGDYGHEESHWTPGGQVWAS